MGVVGGGRRSKNKKQDGDNSTKRGFKNADAWVGRFAGSAELTLTHDLMSPHEFVAKLRHSFVHIPNTELCNSSVNGTETEPSLLWDDCGEMKCDVVTIGEIFNAVFHQKCRCNDAWGRDFLHALVSLVQPDADMFNGLPLVRVVVRRVVAATVVEGGGGGLQTTQENALRITVDVYFHRMIFFLIAFDPLRTVMEVLSKSGDCTVIASVHDVSKPLQIFTTSRKLESGTNQKADDQEADETSCTLPGLLADLEHPGYNSIAQQPGHIALTLKEYQLQTVAWMQDQESYERGLNGLFWEERAWQDSSSSSQADRFYYMPSTGELRLEKPPLVHGGLLCEEMGLGKTVEIVSLITEDTLQVNALPTSDLLPLMSKARVALKTSATLIIVPVTLLAQWQSEIVKSLVDPSSLEVFVYTNISTDFVSIRNDSFPRKLPTPKELQATLLAFLEGKGETKAVVLTTYSMLNKAQHGLNTIHWRRIVLDEMQEIRSSTTMLAKACERLSSDMRWMVSGTPFYTSIDDLNGELNFLKIIPFCLSDDKDGFWGRRVAKPFKRRSVQALHLVHHLCDRILMRHSKSQKYVDSGLPILSLPPTSKQTVAVDFMGNIDPSLLSVTDSQPGKDVVTDSQPVESDIFNKAKRKQRFIALANAMVLRYVELRAVDCIHCTFEDEESLGVSHTSSSSGRTRFVLLNLMRKVCISPSLLNGGAGVSPCLLGKLDTLNRELLGTNHNMPEQAAMEEELSAKVVSAKEAMNLLLQSREIAQTRSDVESGMVRTDLSQQANYNRCVLNAVVISVVSCLLVRCLIRCST
jgi:hypothetical protein